MNIIVVGCGRVGAELAFNLFKKGNKVTVIDHTASAFNNLDSEFRGRTIEGEALNRDVLRRAGIEEADALAAVTNHDALNAVIAYLARSIFNIDNVVARNYDPNCRPLQEVFNIQIVGSSSWGAQRIEELMYPTQANTVFSAGNGEVALYEFVVPRKWDGMTVQELFSNNDPVLAALTRAGKASLPPGDFLMTAGDVLLVSGSQPGIEKLQSRLYEKQEA